MKLTKNSLNVLNNFMNINKNLMIREGNVIKTINEAKTVVAEATIDNEFPQNFGISDLRNFLNTLNIFNEPELEFYEDKIVIKEDNIEYDYYNDNDKAQAHELCSDGILWTVRHWYMPPFSKISIKRLYRTVKQKAQEMPAEIRNSTC